MPSIQTQRTAEQQAFLARYRRAYLLSVGRERGMVAKPDLRELAMQEAEAMIALARELEPKPDGK